MKLRFTPEQPLPSFAQHLATLDHVLPADEFSCLVEEVEELVETERSYLPAHKKGGTVAYETLEREAPGLVELYRSQALRTLIADIVRLRIETTPLRRELRGRHGHSQEERRAARA